MLENEIEKALVDKVKLHGGLCLKFTSPSMTGIPDRIILIPKGRIGFVKTKNSLYRFWYRLFFFTEGKIL